MPRTTNEMQSRQRRDRRLAADEAVAEPAARLAANWRVATGAGCAEVAAEMIHCIENGELPSASVVKHGSHRTVYRLKLAGRALIVKHYHRRAWGRRLGQLLRGSAARREWRKTREAARRGIPTIKLAACLERLHAGLVAESYLVSEELVDVFPLGDYLAALPPSPSATEQVPARRHLRWMLARFTAELHQAGIDHNDFHAGNILLQGASRLALGESWPSAVGAKEAAISPRLVLIDMPDVRYGRPLNWRRSRRGLAMLGTSLWGVAGDAERLRFILTYLRARPGLVTDKRGAVDQLWRMTRAHARRILHGRDDRALRSNRDFRVVSQLSGFAHVVPDISSQAIATLLANPDEPLRRFRYAAIKLSHTSVVVQAELPLGLGEQRATAQARVAYKRSRPATRWKAILGVFRRSRAVEAFRRGHALLQRGIATPRPLAAIVSPNVFRRGDSHLAVEWVDQAENLHLFGWRLAKCSASQRRRRTRQAASSLGHLLGRMHDQHVSHRDLKGTNLILVEQAETVAAMLVDLDGMSIRRWLGPSRRADDLARLAVSAGLHDWVTRADRLRFLRAYLQELPSADRDFKRLWRLIEVRARREARRPRGQDKPRA